MVATQSGDRSILPSELCQGTKNLQGGGATRACHPLVHVSEAPLRESANRH